MTSDDIVRFERRILLLMALVQFINIWDFMIVMPLGPDFARALGIDAGHVGWISGSYSIAAAVVGIAAARFLDRFDRRSVLLFSLTGLTVATFSTILADSLSSLIAARVVTGLFGGPVVASSLAVIADIFPQQRRGEAIGKLFGSFSLAAVVGVPLGLEIARFFGWQAPFVAISGISAIAVAVIHYQLPPMRHHLAGNSSNASLFHSLRHNRAMLPACLLISSSLFAAFLIIPNISAHVQLNLGYPRDWLGLLYFAGGGAAFFSMRFVGRRSDRIGYARMALYATALLWVTLYIGFYDPLPHLPAPLIFILFMIAMSTRNVTSNALISKIPQPHERAGFMSLMSSLQSLMSGAGAMIGTALLVETPDRRLAGMDQVTLMAMIAFAVAPPVMFRIERVIEARTEITRP